MKALAVHLCGLGSIFGRNAVYTLSLLFLYSAPGFFTWNSGNHFSSKTDLSFGLSW